MKKFFYVLKIKILKKMKLNTNFKEKFFCFFIFVCVAFIPKFLKLINYFEVDSSNKNKYFFKFKRYGVSYYKLRKFFKYIKYCMKGILLYKCNLLKSKYPKVSVIITMHNRGNSINSTVKSVQNQSMKNLEIVIIDDYSVDNSIKYIEKLKKIDSRIVLLKNEKNMGALYSKSLGILHAKGKYILVLDSDDMLCIDDYLKYLYIEINIGKYDYIECKESIFINLFGKTIIQKKIHQMCFCSKFTSFFIIK